MDINLMTIEDVVEHLKEREALEFMIVYVKEDEIDGRRDLEWNWNCSEVNFDLLGRVDHAHGEMRELFQEDCYDSEDAELFDDDDEEEP